MTELFDNILFWEGAAYTLWGSKPLTMIIITHYTTEELAQFEKDQDLKASKNCYIVDTSMVENWPRWEQVCAKFPMKRYLLFRSHDSEDGRYSFIYFVDILKTATVIQNNYDLFARAVGFDFHPLEVVLELPNRDSLFWKEVEDSIDSSLLWGLLFGFGRQNVYGFHWRYCDCPPACEHFFQNFPNHFSNPWPVGRVRITHKNFELPTFATFSDEDEQLEEYKKEQAKIREIYRNGDRLEITLKKLTS